jgi:hypothetical protein
MGRGPGVNGRQCKFWLSILILVPAASIGRAPTSEFRILAHDRIEIMRPGMADLTDGPDAVIVKAQRGKWD